METRTVIERYIILTLVVLLLCLCTKKQRTSTDIEMVHLAETYKGQFEQQNLSLVELRSNYYICIYSDTTIYIVTCDSKIIRRMDNQREVVSTNAKNDTCLSVAMQSLLSIVENIAYHELKSVSVKSDSVMLKRNDGYSLTNITPYPFSKYRKVQEGWYVYE